jgi:hypothetical protein
MRPMKVLLPDDYWRRTRRLTAWLLLAWALVAFVPVVFAREIGVARRAAGFLRHRHRLRALHAPAGRGGRPRRAALTGRPVSAP